MTDESTPDRPDSERQHVSADVAPELYEPEAPR
jgi:hypothetical protein